LNEPLFVFARSDESYQYVEAIAFRRIGTPVYQPVDFLSVFLTLLAYSMRWHGDNLEV
jgi:hypothetical protein